MIKVKVINEMNILDIIREREEIIMDVDGYYVYWPTQQVVDHSDGSVTSGGGSYDSAMLRIIANELDHLNEQWHRQIEEELGDGQE